MTPERIRELALANGFKLKDQGAGRMELNPYIYDFVKAVLREQAAQGAVSVTREGTVDPLFRCSTIAEAEVFIAGVAYALPGPVEAGEFGIDAPEAMINPPPAAPTITVDRDALYRVLMSLDGPGHAIRELQATRGPLFDNPIDKLITQFNEQVRK